MRFVSVVVPDWLIAMMTVSLMSGRMPKPESSVAGVASTLRSVASVSAPSVSARLCPATAAVPCPITTTRSMAPLRSRSATACGIVSSPSDAESNPSGSSTRCPRNVLCHDPGASTTSFSRKCGYAPRSMSRVVICAVCTSSGVTGSSVPSYDSRTMPDSVPAASARSATTCPRLPVDSDGVSPSSRTYSDVSSTKP